MRRQKGALSPWVVAGIAAVAAAIACAALATNSLRRGELSTVDTRFMVRGSEPPRAGIVLVALDGRTLHQLELQPPLPRSIHARLIEVLYRARPKLIAYDFQFVGRTKSAEDNALLRALAQARPVLVATHDTSAGPLPVAGRTPNRGVSHVPLGSAAVLNDADGKVRRLLYVPYELPSFDVAAAALTTGRGVSVANFDGNSAWIDYAGPPGTYPTYSFGAVLSGRVPPSTFTGKIVIVGTTDPIEKDVFPTPVSDRVMSGAELHANALATILDGFPLRAVPSTVNYALIVVLVALTAALVFRLPIAAGLGACGVVLIGLGVGAQLAFDEGLIVAVTYPAAGIVLSSVGALATRVASERRQRAHLREVFGRFVPPRVVDDVIARADDDLRLGAIRADATVMFVDLRGFTTFSENEDVNRVMEVINRYFTEVSDAVFAHGGTLLSYNGDGVVAMFGAPVLSTRHADQALAAGREIVTARMPRVNEWLSTQGVGPLGVGVGIASGEVLSGNVGSATRMEYTAIGDVANLAARLQAMTKGSGHQLFLSGETRDRLADGGNGVRYIGPRDVRGRGAKVEVWTIADSA